ncbi:hypothetical protein [Halomonas sp. NO4]|uniref:hypothetical protein n=1 Tax=Halomonas sp. NO4 TaxID=2484813 RepID=UPI001F091443|nr:hypothetical protein [Halomonas sp. NO4]
MKTSMRLLMLAVVATSLTLAGCSYSPARVRSEPLFEVEGPRHHAGHRRYSEERHYRRDDRHYRGRDYRRHRDERYRDRRYRDRRHGGFCPPGLRMQGRC